MNETGPEDITPTPDDGNRAAGDGLLPAAPLFSVEWVRDLLQEHVIPKKGRLVLQMPSPEALAKLASRLNYLAAWFRYVQSLKEQYALRYEFNAKIDQLESMVPAVIREHEELTTSNYFTRKLTSHPRVAVDKKVHFEGLSESTDEFYSSKAKTVAALESLASALVRARRSLGFYYQSPEESSKHSNWKGIAWLICTALWNALSSKNPNVKLGTSGTGPAARFVAAVLPLITGETPEVGTVGNFLKAHRQKEAPAPQDKSKI
jgi:hypothetical protein